MFWFRGNAHIALKVVEKGGFRQNVISVKGTGRSTTGSTICQKILRGFIFSHYKSDINLAFLNQILWKRLLLKLSATCV